MKLSAVLLKVLFITITTSSPVLMKRVTLSPAPNHSMDYLDRALNGLDRALNFFSRSYTEVNLDAVIGTRLVEAALHQVIQRLTVSHLMSKVPLSTLSRIIHLRDISGQISDQAIPYVNASEPDYYANIGPFLDKNLFEMNYDNRNISKSSQIWPLNVQEIYDEVSSDNCMAELFGTKNGITCDISHVCWKQMTSLGYSHYSLSHQILYLEVAERFHCEKEITRYTKENRQGSMRQLQDTFCANMFNEASQIANEGFKEELQDLFMEDTALCGMLGYQDFFSWTWLEKILSWQDRQDGCYKDSEDPLNATRRHLQRRRKREDKVVAGGCSTHKTAVAVGALSQYVRFILERWLQDQHTPSIAEKSSGGRRRLSNILLYLRALSM